jgi:hypothetical protein
VNDASGEIKNTLNLLLAPFTAFDSIFCLSACRLKG